MKFVKSDDHIINLDYVMSISNPMESENGSVKVEFVMNDRTNRFDRHFPLDGGNSPVRDACKFLNEILGIK